MFFFAELLVVPPIVLTYLGSNCERDLETKALQPEDKKPSHGATGQRVFSVVLGAHPPNGSAVSFTKVAAINEPVSVA